MRRAAFWAAAALAALWLPLLARLAPGWAGDPELRHGWAVPLLALYVAWERRGDAPPSRAPRRPGLWWAVAGLGASGLAVLLPVLEANPFWPSVLVLATGAAILATLGALAAWDGARRAAHYAWPAALMFTALPWPAVVQLPVTTGLATANAHVAAELVSYAGHPAVVHGRVIEVGSGLVGIDEACSGMRSLQTVAMVALFFGELFRMGGWRRATLVGAALATAVAGNLARTGFLTWIAATEGVATMEARHDAAGAVALVGTLAVVAGLGRLWARGTSPVARAKSVTAGKAAPAGGRMARGMAAAAIGLMLTAELGTRAWYARGEALTSRVRWELGEPEGWVPAEVPAAAREMLAYGEGAGRYYEDTANGLRWLAFVFNWAGDPRFCGPAFVHAPAVCLPGIGASLEARPGAVEVVAGEGGGAVAVRFETYRFRAEERVQHVFFCVWDGFAGRALDESAGREGVRETRLRQVLEGRRRMDLYQLIFVVEGAGGDDAAITALRRVLPELLRRAE